MYNRVTVESETRGVIMALELRPLNDGLQAEFMRLLPMLEDVLTTNPKDRRFTRYLAEMAENASVLAYTFALCGNRDELSPDKPEFWISLAKDDTHDISEVLYLWQLYAIYQHWYRVLTTSPAFCLHKLGG